MSAPPGWNDPPKYVPPPTGNLKISLNKRIAFPLSPATSAASSSPALPQNMAMPPLSLPPPGPPMPDLLMSTQSAMLTEPQSSNEQVNVDYNAQKDNVLEFLNGEVDKMDNQMKSNVAAKLKSLVDDWESLDVEMKKLLVELVDFLKADDSRGASLVQRKIVMKGSSKQWVHAVRQIILSVESRNHPVPAEAASIDSN